MFARPPECAQDQIRLCEIENSEDRSTQPAYGKANCLKQMPTAARAPCTSPTQHSQQPENWRMPEKVLPGGANMVTQARTT